MDEQFSRDMEAVKAASERTGMSVADCVAIAQLGAVVELQEAICNIVQAIGDLVEIQQGHDRTKASVSELIVALGNAVKRIESLETGMDRLSKYNAGQFTNGNIRTRAQIDRMNAIEQRLDALAETVHNIPIEAAQGDVNVLRTDLTKIRGRVEDLERR